MNPNDFTLWLNGFLDAVGEGNIPNERQFAQIRENLTKAVGYMAVGRLGGNNYIPPRPTFLGSVSSSLLTDVKMDQDVKMYEAKLAASCTSDLDSILKANRISC